MAIIDLVKWSPQGNKTIYAYRFPETNLSTYTQLIVQESQEAVLFSKGQIVGKFGPGKHTLNTENLPILRNLFGIPFGGKNPFTAEVWFVNKIQTFSIDWTVRKMLKYWQWLNCSRKIFKDFSLNYENKIKYLEQ